MTRCAKLLVGLSLTCGLSAGQAPGPEATAEDLQAGERLFVTQCSYCHGPKGEGGSGPVLAAPVLRRAPDEQALMQVIRDGIPNTQMPASVVTGAQARQLAAYVRMLGRVGRSKSSGDSRIGEQVFLGKGSCVRCHTVGGRGGAIGPDLAGVGGRRDSDFIRASILDPEASIPRDFLQVRVVTKTGQKLTGVRLNEDAFSIQIRDLSNQFHSFWKTELTDLVKEPGRSPMPSFRGSLSPAEIDNLVAYLESLQGGS